MKHFSDHTDHLSRPQSNGICGSAPDAGRGASEPNAGTFSPVQSRSRARHALTLPCPFITVPALMSKSALLLSLTLTAAAAAWPQAGLAAVVYRSNEGWSIEGEDTQVEGSAAEQMRKAENLESSGDAGAAYNAYRALVKNFGQSALAPKAQRKVAMLLERRGEYDKAYEAYSTYLNKYPRGEDFDGVVEAQFKIAKLFLDGQKRKVFGVPFAPSMARAQEMFEGIVKRAPFSKWAPLAQFNAGQAFEKQGKYPEAIAAYQTVVAKYPGDPIADDAQYQIGYVLMREAKEGSYDTASRQRARESFEDFLSRYPESEKAPQARENILALQGGVTKSALDIAKYYEKTKKYKAAVIYYNEVVKQQPDSPESTIAKERLEVLRQQFGEDALRAGPERTETGNRARERRKLQAKVDTVSRPDYVGPPVVIPEVQTAPARPRLRTSPDGISPLPAVEPPLPTGPEKLPNQDTGLPKPPE
jgi:outer membrane protein assembly factor BamD